MKKYLFFLLLLSFSLRSQTYECKVFNNKNGLLENEVFNIFRDSKGFLWIHTPRALHVYDGKTLKLFATKVYSPTEGPDGIIHAVGDKCIKKYNPLKLIETVETRGINDQYYDIRRDAFMSASKFIDKDGIVHYFYSWNKEKQDTISLFINGNVKFISLAEETKKGFQPRVFSDNNSTVWLIFEHEKTGEKKLSYFDKGTLIHLSQKIDSKEKVGNIFTTRKKEHYFFCSTKIFKVTETKTSAINVPKEVGSYFFEYRENKCEDSKGNIWLPFEKGLLRINDLTTSLVIDNGPRIMACDSLIESSFDEKGKETISKRWACDARIFIYGITVDSKDRIYTGNKIYENGTFREIFKADGDLIIYAMLVDDEGNIWYATSNGLLKFKALPLTNITTGNRIRGEINHVDKAQNIYTEVRFKEGWTNIKKLLVYEFKNNTYTLNDSLLIRDEAPFDPRTEMSSRFVEFVSAKDKLLIIIEDIIYTYDGKQLKRQDAGKLKLSGNKIPDLFSKNKKIKRNTIFKDPNGFVWFYFDGNFVKTDGTDFWCFGTECGIKDTLKIIEDNFGDHRHDNFPVNKLFCKDRFYFIRNDQFVSYKYTENGLPKNGIRAVVFGDKEKPYFFFDSLSSDDKKAAFVRFVNEQFIKYTIENPDGLRLMIGQAKEYKGKFIAQIKSGGLVKIEIDDNTKKAVFSRIPIDERYLSEYGFSYILNDKLFMFSAFGAMNVFPLDPKTLHPGEPLTTPEYSVFYEPAYIYNDQIFIKNSGGLGEHEQWILKLNSKGEYFNTVPPRVSLIALSYENNGQLTEMFADLNNLEIPYHFNPLKLNFKAICLSDGSKVKYKYLLDGLDEKWIETEEDNLTFTSLPPGNYTFKLMACNNHGVWTEKPVELKFEILPPWNRTWWAYCMYVFAGFAAIRGYLKNRTKKLEKEKEKLENMVMERTAEVVHQKHLIEEKNKEVMDSIAYARRIQRSLMPTEKYISRILSKKK